MFQILLTAKVSKNYRMGIKGQKHRGKTSFYLKKITEMRHYSIQIIKMKLVF